MDFLIWHLLRESTRRWPEKEALVHGEERLSYGEVARRVDGLAAGLRDAELRRGDRMGIYLEASVPQALSIFGISRAEAVYVPINALLHAEQVMHIARDCGMKGLITTAAKLASLAEVLPQIPSLEFLVVVDPGEVAAQLPVHRFEEFCARTLPADWRGKKNKKEISAPLFNSRAAGQAQRGKLMHDEEGGGTPVVFPALRDNPSARTLA